MLNYHVHGGPVGRHQHDLRQGIRYTDEGWGSRSTLDIIQRFSER